MPRCRSGGASVGRSVVAELSGAINLDEIAAGLLSRIHEVTAENVVQSAVVGRADDGMRRLSPLRNCCRGHA